MTPAQLTSYVDAAAAAIGLDQGEYWDSVRPGVLSYFALAAGFAEVVQAVPLTAHDDSPMAFKPVSPNRSAP